MMNLLPAAWSDWELLDTPIGEGAFSTVYEAVRKDDPAIRAAVKAVRIPQDDSEIEELVSQGLNDEQIRSYFRKTIDEYVREVKLMAYFKGTQNIVSIEDYQVVPREDGIGGTILIRMELLSSLDHYLSDKALTEDEVIQIGLDLCAALSLCMSQNIIHRDIKPANIFVNDRISHHVFYKLGDFGIARTMEHRTAGMSSKGTPDYIAPEIALGKPYDARADLYSLGLTLYRLLNNNRLPFFPQTHLYSPAAKREALVRRMSGEKIEPPANASPALAAVILKACSFLPEDRYQNADEMQQALLTVKKDGNPDPPQKETPVLNPKPDSKQKRLPVLTAAAAILVLLIAGYALIRHFASPPTSEAVSVEASSEAEPATPSPTPKATRPSNGDILDITVGQPTTVTLREPGAIQYFRFEPTASATYTVTAVSANGDQVEARLHTGSIQSGYYGDIHTDTDGKSVFRYFLDTGRTAYFHVCLKDQTVTGPVEVTIEQRPVQHEGTCGEDLHWELTDGALMISGTGAMDRYPFQDVPWYDVRYQIENVIVSEGVTGISYRAFYECTNLTNVVLPSSLRQIGDSAFTFCSSLTALTFPEGVEYIGESIFYHCDELRELHLPASLLAIGNNTLGGYCRNLSTITVAPGSESFQVVDGVLLDSTGTILIAHPAGLDRISYIIPGTVKTIAVYAFHSNTSLVRVTIPDSVTAIKACAFSDCSNLRSVVIPDSVVEMEHYAFYGCESLVSVKMSNNLKRVTQQAFSNCSSLTEFVFPEGFEYIGDSFVFSEDYNLTRVYIPSTVWYIDDTTFSNCPGVTIYGQAGSYAQSFAVQYNIPFIVSESGTWGTEQTISTAEST